MPFSEFEAWRVYHHLYPIDDFHRIHRPAAMVAAAFGGQLHARLKWLQPDAADGMTDADMSTLEAFGYSRKGEG